MHATHSMRVIYAVGLAAVSLLVSQLWAQVDYVQPAKPYSSSPFLKTTASGKVNLGRGVVNIPLITWAADGVAVSSNEGTSPKAGTALAKSMGVQANLEVIDDFDKQVANYISGHSPFLRGTVGMIATASEALRSKGADLEPVVIMQLSWSTGADGFVAKNISSLSDLKGKTIVVQKSGPHADLVQVLLQDAGLKSGDVTLKYVRDITYNAVTAKDGKAHDPANALRQDPSLTGAACIFPDILALTAGGQVGTGAEDSVKGARPILSTRTASRVIADVYAVRADFLREQRAIVHGFVLAQFQEQRKFLEEIANVALKAKADKAKLAAFKKTCAPLAKIFLQDAGAVNDYIAWVGLDLELVGLNGNREFFGNARNPVGFAAIATKSLNYHVAGGNLASAGQLETANWNYATDFEAFAGGTVAAAKPKKVFSSTQEVRRAAESEDASLLFSSTFTFPANTSEIKWQNYRDVFDTLHEKVSRYGGAVVQLRGHADNFFYNFVRAKKAQGEKTYRQRVPGTNRFQEKQLPKLEQVVNSANQLSYERAFAVKRAYAQYLREALGYTSDEIDLSRFDIKGMGIGDPIHKSPTTPAQRGENMRGQMFIYAVEAEIPLDFGIDDLQ